MDKHLYTLYEVEPGGNWIEVSKWATAEEALTARSLAFKEQDEELLTGEKNTYCNYIILLEY